MFSRPPADCASSRLGVGAESLQVEALLRERVQLGQRQQLDNLIHSSSFVGELATGFATGTCYGDVGRQKRGIISPLSQFTIAPVFISKLSTGKGQRRTAPRLHRVPGAPPGSGDRRSLASDLAATCAVISVRIAPGRPRASICPRGRASRPACARGSTTSPGSALMSAVGHTKKTSREEGASVLRSAADISTGCRYRRDGRIPVIRACGRE